MDNPILDHNNPKTELKSQHSITILMLLIHTETRLARVILERPFTQGKYEYNSLDLMLWIWIHLQVLLSNSLPLSVVMIIRYIINLRIFLFCNSSLLATAWSQIILIILKPHIWYKYPYNMNPIWYYNVAIKLYASNYVASHLQYRNKKNCIYSYQLQCGWHTQWSTNDCWIQWNMDITTQWPFLGLETTTFEVEV